MEDYWKKGDLAVLTGGTIERSGNFISSFQICEIIEVGLLDLALIQYPSRSFDKIEIVPKASCVKISTDAESLCKSGTAVASLGDLVLSFPPPYKRNEDIFSGILYSIEYFGGNPRNCKILCGEEFKVSAYERLLVLQKNIEQG